MAHAGPSVRSVTKVFGKLLLAIVDVKDKTTMFKQRLISLRNILISLTPTVKDMERLNKQLEHPSEELEPLIDRLEDGIKLVHKCSKVNWINVLWLWCSYNDDLKALEDFLFRHFQIAFLAQISRDTKESLIRQPLNKELQLPEPGKSTQGYAFMLPPKDLYIAWSEDPSYWNWHSDSAGRPQEAELVKVSWLEISGWMTTERLPQNAKYEAYFVFKLTKWAFGFKNKPVEVFLRFLKGERQSRMVYLEGERPPNLESSRLPLLLSEYPKLREDEWLEVKLGEFNVQEGEDKEFEMGVYEIKDLHQKGGLLVRGIEIRAL